MASVCPSLLLQPAWKQACIRLQEERRTRNEQPAVRKRRAKDAVPAVPQTIRTDKGESGELSLPTSDASTSVGERTPESPSSPSASPRDLAAEGMGAAAGDDMQGAQTTGNSAAASTEPPAKRSRQTVGSTFSASRVPRVRGAHAHRPSNYGNPAGEIQQAQPEWPPVTYVEGAGLLFAEAAKGVMQKLYGTAGKQLWADMQEGRAWLAS